MDICPKADSPLPGQAGGESIIDRVRVAGWWCRGVVWGGGGAETAQSSLTVVFKLVMCGLTSIISNVLGTVNLQFQGPFVPLSL